MDENPELEFSRRVAHMEIPAGGKTLKLEARSEERETLARRFGIPGIARLEARLHVRPWRKSGLTVEGTLVADLTRNCVVTLEEINEPIEEAVFLRFAGQGEKPPKKRVSEDESSFFLDDEDPPEEMDGGVAELGEPLAEILAVAMEPYPRKQGVDFVPPPDLDPEAELGGESEQDGADSGDGRQNPFAVLKVLKDS